MVSEQIEARGVRDPRVLRAMRAVPRHRFVPESRVDEACEDWPVPIGHGQTVSQPYIVACMIEALGLGPGARVLEIGTGCGYQAAVLAEAGFGVFTVEIVPELAREAASRLSMLGYTGVRVRQGDGHEGWPEEAPFAGIILAAAPAEVPAALFDQLAPDGVLVAPVGRGAQDLWRHRRTPQGLAGERLLPVRFVPMVRGQAGG
jgi:protein-L-isoaspartate(D-aspartate) O-methyltransferase